MDSSAARTRPGSTLSVKALASGSSGNCILIRAGDTALLVDCGISTKSVSSYLNQRGIAPESVAAILLTHEHIDHVSGVGTFSRKYGASVVSDPRTLQEAERMAGKLNRRPMALGSSQSIGDVEVSSFPVPHDAAAPSGFVIKYRDWTVAVCVDLGDADEVLHSPLSEADLLVMEANHDYDKLKMGPYAPNLKARILSNRGHLSNFESARLIAGSYTGKPRTVWLAHLSAVSNSPRLASRIVGSVLRKEGVGNVRLQVIERTRPSLCWSSDSVGWQLPLLEWSEAT